MAEEYKQIACREIGADCDFVAQGKTDQEVVDKCAEHAKSQHGVMGFPPGWYVMIRSHMRTVQV